MMDLTCCTALDIGNKDHLVWAQGGKRKLERQGSGESFDSSWSSYLDGDEDVFLLPPETKKLRQSKKTVRFAKDVEVKLRHATKEDLENAWLKQKDWENSKAECKDVIAAIIEANGDLSLLDMKRHCIRGLEEYISTVLYNRGTKQRAIVRKIVYVHHCLRKNGTKDQSGLKKAYLALSKKHRCRALKRAAVDAYNSGAVKCYLTPKYPED